METQALDAVTWAERLGGVEHGDGHTGEFSERDASDYGNAERLVGLMEDELRYLTDHAVWVLRRGGRWFRVDQEVVRSYAADSVNDYCSAVEDQVRVILKARLVGDKQQAALELMRDLHSFAIDSLNLDRLDAALELAKGPEFLACEVGAFVEPIIGIEVDR